MKRILVVFETNKQISENLNFEHADFLKIEEVRANTAVLGKYKCILDCTVSCKIYNAMRGKSIEYNASIPYLETNHDSIVIVQGITYSRLTQSTFDPSNESMKKSEEHDVSKYFELLQFLTTKIPELANIQKFEESLEKGIILNEFMKDKQKVYLLVREIPKLKERNVEYITLDGLGVLSKLEDVLNRETTVVEDV